MSDKVREEFEKWVNEHPDHLIPPRNFTERDGNGGYTHFWTESNWRAWKAALRTHENESEAVATLVKTDHGVSVKDVRWFEKLHIPAGNYQLFLAPPSAKAIETAAIIQAVEVCERLRASIIPCDRYEAGKQNSAYVLKRQILALIPQDGRTALEEFGVKVGTEMLNQCGDIAIGINELRTIVTNLIGVPPLNSGTVSGEE